MHRFRHFGTEPMVDHLLHCEDLRKETTELALKMQWPQAMRRAAEVA